MSIKEVTYFIAVCDGCKEDADYGDFTAWGDSSSAVEMAGEDWFERTKVVKEIPPCEDHPLGQKIIETVELLCPACQKCEICGESGYQMDDHLVCDEHEDHDFTVVPAPTETEWQTWQEVPDGVPYRSSVWRSGVAWFNRDNNRYVQTSSVRNSDGTSYISGVDDDDMNTNLAPFVAAEEG